MSTIPIGAIPSAARGAAKPATSPEESEGAAFGMALGLAIAAPVTAAPVSPATQGPAALAPADATADGAQAATVAGSASNAGAPVANGAARTMRALMLELGQALHEDLARGALADAANATGAIPIDAGAEEPLTAGEKRAARALAAALAQAAEPGGPPVASVGAIASEMNVDRLARAPRSNPRTANGGQAPPATPVVDSTRTAAAAASPATDRVSVEGPMAPVATPARAHRDTPADQTARNDAPVAMREPPAGAIPPFATIPEAARPDAGAAPGRGAAALPRDLTAALDAASMAPRRALDQVTLPFEGENGLEGRLRIALRGNTLHATIVTPDRDSAARIEGAMGELHRALVERGFGEVKLAVQHAPATQESDRARADSREPGREHTQRKAARDDERAGTSHQHRRRERNERGQEG